MTRKILINGQHAEELRVAIVDNRVLEDYEIEAASSGICRNNIYRGVVVNTAPSLNAAFIDFGEQKHGFLAFNDVVESCYAKPVKDPSKAKIGDVLTPGQVLIVQVIKDATSLKGAQVTTNISIAGRYLVLRPKDAKSGVSRKVDDDARADLSQKAKSLDLPDGCGCIVRTNAIDQPRTTLLRDAKALVRLWQKICAEAQKGNKPQLLYNDQDIVVQAMRDYFDSTIEEVLIDNKACYERALAYVRACMPSAEDRIKFYQDRLPLFTKFNIERQIDQVFDRNIKLPSGGFIVIDPTEALTAIDVNSSRSTKRESQDLTAYHTNLEAAVEIAKQLRLRDIGGLIVVDFIDMRSGKHQRDVERVMRTAMARDKARNKIERISANGLLEINRQRINQALSLRTHLTCPTCGGRGYVPTTEMLGRSILRQVESKAIDGKIAGVTITLNPEVALAVQNERRQDIFALEKEFAITIKIQSSDEFSCADNSLEWISKTATQNTKSNNNDAPVEVASIIDVEEEINENDVYRANDYEEFASEIARQRRLERRQQRAQSAAENIQPAEEDLTYEQVEALSNLDENDDFRKKRRSGLKRPCCDKREKKRHKNERKLDDNNIFFSDENLNFTQDTDENADVSPTPINPFDSTSDEDIMDETIPVASNDKNSRRQRQNKRKNPHETKINAEQSCGEQGNTEKLANTTLPFSSRAICNRSKNDEPESTMFAALCASFDIPNQNDNNTPKNYNANTEETKSNNTEFIENEIQETIAEEKCDNSCTQQNKTRNRKRNRDRNRIHNADVSSEISNETATISNEPKDQIDDTAENLKTQQDELFSGFNQQQIHEIADFLTAAPPSKIVIHNNTERNSDLEINDAGEQQKTTQRQRTRNRTRARISNTEPLQTTQTTQSVEEVLNDTENAENTRNAENTGNNDVEQNANIELSLEQPHSEAQHLCQTSNSDAPQKTERVRNTTRRRLREQQTLMQNNVQEQNCTLQPVANSETPINKEENTPRAQKDSATVLVSNVPIRPMAKFHEDDRNPDTEENSIQENSSLETTSTTNTSAQNTEITQENENIEQQKEQRPPRKPRTRISKTKTTRETTEENGNPTNTPDSKTEIAENPKPKRNNPRKSKDTAERQTKIENLNPPTVEYQETFDPSDNSIQNINQEENTTPRRTRRTSNRNVRPKTSEIQTETHVNEDSTTNSARNAIPEKITKKLDSEEENSEKRQRSRRNSRPHPSEQE